MTAIPAPPDSRSRRQPRWPEWLVNLPSRAGTAAPKLTRPTDASDCRVLPGALETGKGNYRHREPTDAAFYLYLTNILQHRGPHPIGSIRPEQDWSVGNGGGGPRKHAAAGGVPLPFPGPSRGD